MSNFALYLFGVLIVVGALVYGATLLGVDPTWIGIFALVIVGVGIMSGVAKTRRREPSQSQ